MVDLAELARLPLRLVAREVNPPLVDLVVGACVDAGTKPVFTGTGGGLEEVLSIVGVGEPSWTVLYAARTDRLRNPRVAFRPTRPPLALTTYLAIPNGEPSSTTATLIDACSAVG